MPNTKSKQFTKFSEGAKVTERLESDGSTFVDSSPEDGAKVEHSRLPTDKPAASAQQTTSSTYADALKAKASGSKVKADNPGKSGASGVKANISKLGDTSKFQAPDENAPRPRSHFITPSELYLKHKAGGNDSGGVKLQTHPANSAPPSLDLEAKDGSLEVQGVKEASGTLNLPDLPISPYTRQPSRFILSLGPNNLFSTPLGSEYDAMGSEGFKSQLSSLNPSFHNSPTQSPENGSPTRRNSAFPGRLRHNTVIATNLGPGGGGAVITRDDRPDESLAFDSSPPMYPDGHIMGAEKQRRNALVPGETASLDEHWLDEVKQKLVATSTTDVQSSTSRNASDASYAQHKSSEADSTNGTLGSHVDKGKDKAKIDAWIGTRTITAHSNDGEFGGHEMTGGREEHECLEKGASCIHCFPVAIEGREKMRPYPGNSSHQPTYASNANTNNHGDRVGSYGSFGGNTYGEFDEHGIYHPQNPQCNLSDQLSKRKNFTEQFGEHRELSQQFYDSYGHCGIGAVGKNGLRGGAASFTGSYSQRAVSDPVSAASLSQASTQYDGTPAVNAPYSEPLGSALFVAEQEGYLRRGSDPASISGPFTSHDATEYGQSETGNRQLNQHEATAHGYRALNESLISSQYLDAQHAALSRERTEIDIQKYMCNRISSNMRGRPSSSTTLKPIHSQYHTQSQGQGQDQPLNQAQHQRHGGQAGLRCDDGNGEHPHSRGSQHPLPSTTTGRGCLGTRLENVPSLGIIGVPQGNVNQPSGPSSGGMTVAEFKTQGASSLQKFGVQVIQPPQTQHSKPISGPGYSPGPLGSVALPPLSSAPVPQTVFGLKKYTTSEDDQRLRAEAASVTSQGLGSSEYYNEPSRDLDYGVAQELWGIYDRVHGTTTPYATAYPNSAYTSQPNSALAHFARPDRSRATPGGLSIEEQDRRDAARKAALAADPQKYAQVYGCNGMTDAAGGRIIGHETSEGPIEYGGPKAYGRLGQAPGQQRRGSTPGNPYEQNAVPLRARPNHWGRLSGDTAMGMGRHVYGQAPPNYSSHFGGHNRSVDAVMAGISRIEFTQSLLPTRQYQQIQQGRNISGSTDVSHLSTSSGNHPSSQTSGQAEDGPIGIEVLTSPGSKPLPVSEIFKERTQALIHGSTLRPFSPARFIEPFEPGTPNLPAVRSPSVGSQQRSGGIGSSSGSQYGGSLYGGGCRGKQVMIGGELGPYSHMLPSQSLSHYSRASTPSSIGDGQSHQQSILGMHPSFGGGLGGLIYRGVRPTTHTFHSSIPDNLNTCLWIECLPPDITYAELLSSIRSCGRIFSTHINYPSASHTTSAAKVAFFRRESAENLMRLGLEGKFSVRGFRSLVRWNRNKYSESGSDKGESRVLLVRGHKKYVNEATLSEYFNKLFWYNLVYVETLSIEDASAHGLLDDTEEVAIWSADPEPGHTGELEQGESGSSLVTSRGGGEDTQIGGLKKLRIGVMVWEFGSFHAQAQAAKQAIEREPKFIGRVRVDYLKDPCE